MRTGFVLSLLLLVVVLVLVLLLPPCLSCLGVADSVGRGAYVCMSARAGTRPDGRGLLGCEAVESCHRISLFVGCCVVTNVCRMFALSMQLLGDGSALLSSPWRSLLFSSVVSSGLLPSHCNNPCGLPTYPNPDPVPDPDPVVACCPLNATNPYYRSLPLPSLYRLFGGTVDIPFIPFLLPPFPSPLR